jgi:hypothetical protein
LRGREAGILASADPSDPEAESKKVPPAAELFDN